MSSRAGARGQPTCHVPCVPRERKSAKSLTAKQAEFARLLVEGHAPVNAVRLAGFRFDPRPEHLIWQAQRLAALPQVAGEIERLRLLRRDIVVRDAREALEHFEQRKLVRLWEKALVAIDQALDGDSPPVIRLRAAELVARMAGMIEPDRHLHLHEGQPVELSEEDRARLRRIAARVVDGEAPGAATLAVGPPAPATAPEAG